MRRAPTPRKMRSRGSGRSSPHRATALPHAPSSSAAVRDRRTRGRRLFILLDVLRLLGCLLGRLLRRFPPRGLARDGDLLLGPGFALPLLGGEKDTQCLGDMGRLLLPPGWIRINHLLDDLGKHLRDFRVDL